jgi:hypothetical protein
MGCMLHCQFNTCALCEILVEVVSDLQACNNPHIGAIYDANTNTRLSILSEILIGNKHVNINKSIDNTSSSYVVIVITDNGDQQLVLSLDT